MVMEALVLPRGEHVVVNGLVLSRGDSALSGDREETHGRVFLLILI